MLRLRVFQVEGVEKIYVRYQSLVCTTESKTYDFLDHRNLEVSCGITG